jgi:hypothetical protein
VSPVFMVWLGSMRTTSAPATDDTRLVQYPAGHDVQLAGTEPDLAVIHPDGQFAAPHQEELVGLRVGMAGELAAGLHHPDVVVVHQGHGERRPRRVERRQGRGEIHGFGHPPLCRPGPAESRASS